MICMMLISDIMNISLLLHVITILLNLKMGPQIHWLIVVFPCFSHNCHKGG